MSIRLLNMHLMWSTEPAFSPKMEAARMCRGTIKMIKEIGTVPAAKNHNLSCDQHLTKTAKR